MSQPSLPSPAKLVIGIFTPDKDLFEPAAGELDGRYGPMDIVSPWFPFDCTDYYTREMGEGLQRRMIAFQNPVAQDRLADIKHYTNQLERQYMAEGNRRVNIDPGYLLPERFVLATGKNFAHRIYIGKHIYADLTLIYHDNAYRPLPWTYPDYARPDMLAFLSQVRKKYIYDQKGPNS